MDCTGYRHGSLTQPALRRLIVEPAVPEHDATQTRGLERQLPDLYRVQTPKLQRDLTAEHGDHVGLRQNRTRREIRCLQCDGPGMPAPVNCNLVVIH